MARPFHLGQDRASVADVTLCLMPARRVSMIASLYRPLMIGLLPIALIACMSSGPVAASPQPQAPIHIASAGEGQSPHPQHMSEMQMAHAGHNDAHGTGTV